MSARIEKECPRGAARSLLRDAAPFLVGCGLAMGLAACGGSREGGAIRWSATCPEDPVRVGDSFELVISGSWPDAKGPAHLAWGLQADSVVVLSRDSTAVRSPAGWKGRTYRIRALLPRPGSCRLPPAALVGREGDTLALTTGCTLRAGGRIPAQGEAQLRPLAPLASLRRFPWWLAIVAAGVLAAVLLARAYWRRRRALTPALEAPPLPPAIEFEQGLERLYAQTLPEKGEMRAFAQELSWILRRYLGRRWLRPALEATRPEIIRWLPETRLCVRDQGELAGWLARTDRIKFAGEMPLIPEAQGLAAWASAMVKRTEEIWRRDAEAAPAGAGGPGPAAGAGGEGPHGAADEPGRAASGAGKPGEECPPAAGGGTR